MTTKTRLKQAWTAYRVEHLTDEQRAELKEMGEQIMRGLRERRERTKINLGKMGANELIMALGAHFRKTIKDE